MTLSQVDNGHTVEGLPLLQLHNIKVGCSSTTPAQAIDLVGGMLVQSGYVTSRYLEGMHAREQIFSTNIGGGIAIPHGEGTVEQEILQSGIAVAVYPQGIVWGDSTVYLVVGLAGKGDEHLGILQNVALHLSQPEAVEQLVQSGSPQQIFGLLADGQNP